ncbi:MAG: response regulator [Clostridiales Family XIII bacterium]|jgi:CheY-like chemotaxis protein/signal transduction histidine kinase/HPt (histidine-containing phosphotransfer) domain-containing protein|nr:response regulator [Clostridiales Family XIII bacterium]
MMKPLSLNSAPLLGVAMDMPLENLSTEDLFSLVRDLIKENRKLSRQAAGLRERMKKLEVFDSILETVETVHLAERHKMEKYMRLLLENSRNIVLFLDRNGRLVYCTHIFLKLFGIPSADAVKGRTLQEVYGRFVDEKHAAAVTEAFREVSEKLTPFENDIDARVHNASGEEECRPYTIMITPFPGENGGFGGAVLLYHDTTDVQARILAEDANAAKDQFIANVSHEIRTPLNTILGLSELELRKELPEDTSANLDRIYGAGKTLLGLINDILDVSKIRSGKFELSESEYSVLDMLRESIDLNVVRITDKPIVFEVDVDGNIPHRLYGDGMRVKQILNNLLSNAFKFTEKGVVGLRVSFEPDGEDVRLAFAVRDTGRGIKRADMGELFKSYNQFEAAPNQKLEGSGLGLSICKCLAEMMGGSVGVESEYGKGSVFTAEIKQRVADGTPIGADAARDLRAFRFAKRFCRDTCAVSVFVPEGRVLVVDDVSANLDVAKGLLSCYGLTADCASGGAEALAMIRRADVPYDLIFMDHMMPHMDGLETVRAIRSERGGAHAKTPIVMLTANVVAGRREMFLRSGADDFLEKPIGVAKLDDMLRRWMPQEKQLAPLACKSGGADENARAADLPAIPGLDVDCGLANSGGSCALYRNVLASFCRNVDEKAAQIESSAAAGDFKLYTTLVHGIRGAAASVGANAAASFAESLETAGENADLAVIAARTGEFLSGLADLARSIRAATANRAADVPGDEAAVCLHMADLKKALLDMDIQAVNALMAEYAALPLDEKTRESVFEIEERILLFEYDAAIGIIDALLRGSENIC